MARPKHLAELEERYGSRAMDGVARPMALETRAANSSEVRVDDRELEPTYSPSSIPEDSSKVQGGNAGEVLERSLVPYVSVGLGPDSSPGDDLQPGEGSGPRPPGTPGTESQRTAVEVVKQLAIEGPATTAGTVEVGAGEMLPPQGLAMVLAPRTPDVRPSSSESRRDRGLQQSVHSWSSHVQNEELNFQGPLVESIEASETQFELIFGGTFS